MLHFISPNSYRLASIFHFENQFLSNPTEFSMFVVLQIGLSWTFYARDHFWDLGYQVFSFGHPLATLFYICPEIVYYFEKNHYSSRLFQVDPHLTTVNAFLHSHKSLEDLPTESGIFWHPRMQRFLALKDLHFWWLRILFSSTKVVY